MTKKLFTAMMMAAAVGTASAAIDNHPDSVFLKAVNPDPTQGLQLSYSVDQKTWINIGHGYNVFKGDYGPWGSEKKMHTPVLKYDGKTFYAEFIPSPNNPQVATTQSADLYLWKPQDYPTLSKTDFEAKKAELAKGSKNNVLRVPYYIIESLVQKVQAAEARAKAEQENMMDDQKLFAGLADVKVSIKADVTDAKPISPDLFGIFFEDINYAADGGLYAELIQNRDFEYIPNDHTPCTPKHAWELKGTGTDWTISTDDPISKNNANYTALSVGNPGAKLINTGWDGIALKSKAKYDISMFLRGTGGKVKVSLMDGDKTIATTTMSISKTWKQQKAVLTANADCKNAHLAIEPLQAGIVNIDFVSLFPQDTYKGRKNGLRKDLATTLADLKPQFIRFPGGCMSHGQGIDNIYHWQATVGPLWDREPAFNIWNYHQTRGLGFYEYFQYCEDIGAQPLPVLAAGVPCQNSWKGGNGQQGGIPFERDLKGKPSPYTYMGKPLTMESYLQELIDLIEWANGDPKTSKLAKMRADAGHPKPFGLKYLGIGNEDLISDVFVERYNFLSEGVKKAHPEITIVGTVGPFWEGSDYEYGWKLAKEKNISIVDEHYYNNVGWFLNNQNFYDKYDRNGTKVYLGEWASRGNRLENALAEAIHITNVERNADVVVMSSYAPLLAKEGHTQWNPDMIYFNNTEVKPTVNYWIQALCGQNAGDEYIYSNLSIERKRDRSIRINDADVAKRISTSIVKDKETGDIIIKLVNALPTESNVSISLDGVDMTQYKTSAAISTVTGEPADMGNKPTTKSVNVGKDFVCNVPKYSFSVVRIQKIANKK